MKKTIIVALSAIIGASLVTGNGIAQRAANPSYAASKSNNKTSLREYNKSVAGNTIDPVEKTSIKESKNAIKATKINLRVTHHLNKNFKNPSDVLWYTDDNIKVAKFNVNDQSARVAYDKNGGWLYSIITYHGNQMPREITSLVNNEYKGFTISQVKEISQWDKTFHLVYAEDNNSYKQLIVYNGEITVYDDFKKSL